MLPSNFRHEWRIDQNARSAPTSHPDHTPREQGSSKMRAVPAQAANSEPTTGNRSSAGILTRDTFSPACRTSHSCKPTTLDDAVSNPQEVESLGQIYLQNGNGIVKQCRFVSLFACRASKLSGSSHPASTALRNHPSSGVIRPTSRVRRIPFAFARYGEPRCRIAPPPCTQQNRSERQRRRTRSPPRDTAIPTLLQPSCDARRPSPTRPAP